MGNIPAKQRNALGRALGPLLMAGLMVLSSLLLAAGGADGTVTPGSVTGLVSSGQRTHENSTAVPVFGIGATSSTGSDTFTRADIQVRSRATGFSMSDLDTISTDQTRSGVALYRDSGATDDALDSSDVPVTVSSFSVSSGGSPWTVTLNLSSEAVPTTSTGSYRWIMVVRTSSTIGLTEAFQIELSAGAFRFSDSTTMPSSARSANILSCYYQTVSHIGTSSPLLIGEDGAPVDTLALQGLSLFSGRLQLELLSSLVVEVRPLQNFDLWTDLRKLSTTTGSGLLLYLDSGGNTPDVWDPSEDTFIQPLSVSVQNMTSPSTSWKVTFDFATSGVNSRYVPGSTTGSYDVFLCAASSTSIGNRDMFHTAIPAWGLEYLGSDGQKKTVIPAYNRSRDVKADSLPLDLRNASLRITSTRGYFYEFDTDLVGRDEVFYNSVTAQGLGQELRIYFQGFTEDNPYELRGEAAFDKTSGTYTRDNPTSPVISYTVTQTPPNNPITFTLIDKVGHRTTWDVFFTEDNMPPRVSNLTVADSSQYIKGVLSTRHVYFRPNMAVPNFFYIAGTAFEPKGEAGVYEAVYDLEPSLYSSPPRDTDPAVWNGSYGIDSLSLGADSPLTARIRDHVLNTAMVSFNYSRITSTPIVQLLAPTQSGTNVSGVYRVTARVSSVPPIGKVEFSVDDSTDLHGMAFAGIVSGWNVYYYDWDTLEESEGAHALRIKATDSVAGVGYNTTFWVNVNNYPLWGSFVYPTYGASLKGDIDVTLTVSTYCNGAELYLGSVLVDSYTGFPVRGAISLDLDTKLFTDGTYLLKVHLRGFGGRSVDLVLSVEIDNAVPALSGLRAVFPGTQTAADVGDLIRIRATVYDNGSGLEAVSVIASAIGGAWNGTGLYDDGLHADGNPSDGLFSSDEIEVSAVWAFHSVRVSARDRAGNVIERYLKVPVDPKSPFVEDAWVEYPEGQSAAKDGDQVQFMAKVTDLTAPLYITLVLDNSGSMWTSGNMDDLIRAAKVFVNSTRSIDRVAIYRFYEEGESGFPGGPPGKPKRILDFTQMNDTGKVLARAVIDGITEMSGTPIWDAIGNATDYTIQNAGSSPLVVAFTDGADDYNLEEYPRFEEGSQYYAPWSNWGTSNYYTYHWGKYLDQGYWSDTGWVDNGTTYYWVRSAINDFRSGLLNIPIPVYTIGLGLEHHDPPNLPQRSSAPSDYLHDNNAYWTAEYGTPEYNLWRVATTSAGGGYYYAPSASVLEAIYRNIAGSIYSTENPAKIVKVMVSLDLEFPVDIILYDDGLHGDGLSGDATYGSDLVDIGPFPTEDRYALMRAWDWANNTGNGNMTLTIDNSLPELLNLTVVYPPGRSSVADGEGFHIMAEVRDLPPRPLTIIGDGSALGFFPPITFNNAGTGNDLNSSDDNYTSISIVPATGGIPSTYMFIPIEIYDTALNLVLARAQVLIVNDRYAPIVNMIAPRNGGYLGMVDEISSLVDDDGVIQSVRYLLFDENGGFLTLGYMDEGEAKIFSSTFNAYVLPEGNYLLEVRATDSSGREGTTGRFGIGIDNSDPVLSVTSPADGSYVSGNASIKVNAVDVFLNRVTYSVDGGPGTDTFRGLNTTLYSEGYHDVVITAMDLSGKRTSITLGLYFDNSIPSVDLLHPSSGVMLNGTVSIFARVSDGGGLSFVEARIYDWGNRQSPTPPNSSDIPVAVVVLDGPDLPIVLAGYYSGPLATIGLPDSRYLLSIEAVDRAGTIGYGLAYMPVDNSFPVLRVLEPLDGGSVSTEVTPRVDLIEPFLADAYYTFAGIEHPINQTLNVTGLPEGSYIMRFVASDLALRTTIVELTVHVDRTSPDVEVMSPADGTRVFGELKVMARVRENAGLRYVFLYIDGISAALGETTDAGGLYYFAIDLSSFNRSAHVLTVVAENMAGLRGISGPVLFFRERWDTDDDGVEDPYDDEPMDPFVTGDVDGDGFGSIVDDDDDGDGVYDILEPSYESRYVGGAGKGFGFQMDPTEWSDTDGDGIGDNSDPDADNDGVVNEYDEFPLNSTEWGDVDKDGIGDSSDPDIDGDGFRNRKDKFPFDTLEWRDTDRDGNGNNRDLDDDNDGVPDSEDDFPLNRYRSYRWEPLFFLGLVVLLCTLLLFSAIVFRERIDEAAERSWRQGALRTIRDKLTRGSGDEEPPGRPERRRPVPLVDKGPRRADDLRTIRARERRGRDSGPPRKVPPKDPPFTGPFMEEEKGGHKVRWSKP